MLYSYTSSSAFPEVKRGRLYGFWCGVYALGVIAPHGRGQLRLFVSILGRVWFDMTFLRWVRYGARSAAGTTSAYVLVFKGEGPGLP
jgi:hypothetical protein